MSEKIEKKDQAVGLDRVGDLLYDCFFCGACYGRGPANGGVDMASYDHAPLKRCPPREYFKFRAYSTMGFMRTAWSVAKDHVSLSPEVADYYYSCLGCDFCSYFCRTTQTMEVIRGMREEIVKHDLLPEPLKKLNEKIDRSNNIFGARESRSKWAEGLNLPKTGKMLYFAGCYAAYTHKETARATVAVLRSAGIDVAFLGDDEWHCGLAPAWEGSVSGLKKMAEHNVGAIKAAEAETVIFSCPECYRTFNKDYKDVLGELPFKSIHIAELLDPLVSEGKIKFAGSTKQKVTYHDPCHLGRHLKVYKQPRKVIQAIPETELAEMEHSKQYSWCCGMGSGVTKDVHPEFAKWTASERIKEAKETADTLVTACARCINLLRPEAVKNDMEVVDLPVFVADAMGLSYEEAMTDKTKAVIAE